MDRVLRNAPVLLLIAMIAAAAALLLALTSGLTYFQDTWGLLIERRDITVDSVLVPHNEHIAAAQTLIQKAFLEIFGMDSALPEYVLLVAGLSGSAALLFVYLRRRVGDWLALMGVALLLFLGPAYEVLLWPFEICFVGTVFFGLAMLLALERRDRRWDAAAFAFLAIAMTFSSLGVAFAVAAAVQIFIDRERSGFLRRAYVFVIPVALFAIWYLGWGSDAESHLSLRNVLMAPRFVAEGVAFTIGSLLGLSTSPRGAETEYAWGIALLIASVVVVAWRQTIKPGFSLGLWPVLAAAAANWFLTALNFMPGRDPTASRYLYAGGLFVLMIAANLLDGVRPGRRALCVLGAVTVAAVAVNLPVLKSGQEWLENETLLTRSDLAALQIAERTVDPDFQLGPEVAGTPSLVNVYAGKYLEAVDEYGSPAYTPEELEAAPEAGRKQADIVLSQALPLSTVTTLGQVRRRGGQCVRVEPGAAEPVTLAPGTTTIAVEPGAPAQFNLRRFATEEFPVQTEGAPGGSTTALRIPADRAGRPWQLQVVAEQPAFVCAPTS